MVRILIIADDLTGANDSAVQFAERGFSAATMLLSEDGTIQGKLPGAQVLAVSTESRNLTPERALGLMGLVVPGLIDAFSPDVVFKKIDSTLRGNPGVETQYVSALLDKPAVIAPAYPQNGRTVRDGYLLVDGKMLSETYAASDLLAPASSSYVPDYFSKPGMEFSVADATTERDLDSLVESRRRDCREVLWAGSAGLARALAGSLTPAGPAQGAPPECHPGKGRTLVLFGSLHPAAIAQVEALHGATDCAVILPLSESGLKSLLDSFERMPESTVVVATHRVKFGPNDSVPAEAAARSMKSFFGDLAGKAADSRRFRNMVISGGDVAYAVLRSLDASALRICSEILPGVAFGSVVGGRAEGMGIVTKAGGFGSDQTLKQIVVWLRQ